jgi:peptidoglycan/xylan/chitin deacetylase (PgdA/CDA1 family)
MSVWSSINFHLVKWFSRNRYCDKNSAVLYLTFDDGPDPGITEFVLDTLAQYNVKATFFCCGKQAELYPELMHKILDGGHRVANHTYSHINGLKVQSSLYYKDIDMAHNVLKTRMFRPPWGGKYTSILSSL